MQQVTCTAEQPERHSDGQLRYSGVAAFLDGLLHEALRGQTRSGGAMLTTLSGAGLQLLKGCADKSSCKG